MAAPSYTTDLTTINVVDTAGGTTNWTALGGGASGLNSETDYYIQGDGCVSKNGFTASTKGMIYNATSQTINAGDAVFMWARQANRNLLDTLANGGGRLLIGSSTSDYDQFDVDGNNVDGSDLLSWVSYAVDPTATASRTTGTPTATTSHFGFLWKILGSGSLKGAPNGIDAFRHGRELICTDGDAGNGYATFEGAAAQDATTTRRWGILTPTTTGYLFHGLFRMGSTGTSVDFRDSNRNISVLEDPFVSSSFNSFSITNASSNVEWTAISINALGTTAPFKLILSGGTFTGADCSFNGADTTSFSSSGSMTNSSWENCARITTNGSSLSTTFADLSGSSILTSTVVADEGAVFCNIDTTTSTDWSHLDNLTISQGTNAHHAIRFGVNVTDDITLTGCEFTGFSSSDDVNGSTFRFDATSGSLNLNLNNCTVDGAAATTSNIGIDDAAGITVTIIISPVIITTNVKNLRGENIEDARVQIEAGEKVASGLPFRDSISITRSGSTASVSHTAHGLSNGEKVVIRHADQQEYNGNQTISNVSANAYDYTVTGTPATPATSSYDHLINQQDETSYDNSPTTEGTFAAGSGHAAGDVVTLEKGIKITVDSARVDNVIDAQDETSYDNSPADDGTFGSGFAHAVSDVITVDKGVKVTVDAVSIGNVTQFTVDNSSQSAVVNEDETLDQVSTTGSGTLFSLSPGANNLQTTGMITEFTVNSGDQLRRESVVSGTALGQISTTGSGTGFTLTPDTDNIDVDFIGSTYVLNAELTDASGNVSIIKTLTVNQLMTGWARKSTASPLYQQANINFTADKDTGNAVNVTLLDDE